MKSHRNQETKCTTFANKETQLTLTHGCVRQYKMVDSNQHINFVFADINENLKLKLNETLERSKYTHTFHSREDLEDIFDKFGWDKLELDNEK